MLGALACLFIIGVIVVGWYRFANHHSRKMTAEFQVFTLKPGRKRNANLRTRKSGQRKRNKHRIPRR